MMQHNNFGSTLTGSRLRNAPSFHSRYFVIDNTIDSSSDFSKTGSILSELSTMCGITSTHSGQISLSSNDYKEVPVQATSTQSTKSVRPAPSYQMGLNEEQPIYVTPTQTARSTAKFQGGLEEMEPIHHPDHKHYSAKTFEKNATKPDFSLNPLGKCTNIFPYDRFEDGFKLAEVEIKMASTKYDEFVNKGYDDLVDYK
jgi:hypothetical protein